MAGGWPSGTVTFVFTDIEGSTAMWDRSPRVMARTLPVHDELVRRAIAGHGGVVFAETGDGFGGVFVSAASAVRAAAAVQRAVGAVRWPVETPVRVRVGVHTGDTEERGGNYFGATVSRAARVAEAGNGNQVVVSAATAALVADDGPVLVDQGLFRLDGFARAERLFRLVVDGVTNDDRPLRQPETSLGNLPHRRARLFGRERELELLTGLLVPGALVTLTGVGGVGKTRLAVAAARRRAGGFPEGVWLVELADAVSPGDVPAAVAGALGLRVLEDHDPVAALAEALEPQQRLVILDNCEHVLGVAGALADAVAARCPAVTVLATSREALGLDGERIVPLRPLATVGTDGPSAAVQLFCDRAAGVLGGFDPDTGDLATIEALCRRVDGLPLAIELAASRLTTMSVGELAGRLDDRFRVLTRRRGAVERHQSLTTTVAWSYELLSANEQVLFDRLSVFAGGFDLVAANAVAGAAPFQGDVEEPLAGLVDKSLVAVERDATGSRYRLLEMIRQYAEERLHERGETDATRRRHLDHYVTWAERADTGLQTPDEPRWHRAFLAEWHNLRTAFHWGCELDDADTTFRLLNAVYWWAGLRMQIEVADWSIAALTLPSGADHPGRPRVLAAAAWFAWFRHDLDTGDALMARAWAEAERLGAPEDFFVPGLAAVGELIHARWVSAVALLDDSERIAVRAGDDYWADAATLQRASCRVIAHVSGGLLGDSPGPLRAAVEASLAAVERRGQPSQIAHALQILGTLLVVGAPDEAVRHFERAANLAASVGLELGGGPLVELHAALGHHQEALDTATAAIDRAIPTGVLLNLFSALEPTPRPLVALGYHELAATVIGRCREQDDGDALAERHGYNALEAQLRDTLAPDHLDRLLQQGRTMPVLEVARLLNSALAAATL